MSALAISPRDRRTLAFGLVTMAILILLARGIPALRRWTAEAHIAASRQRAELGRVRQLRALLPAMRDSARARRVQFEAVDSILVDGDSPASAAAELAAIVGEAADSARVQIGTVQVRHDSVARGGFARVSVRATLTGDVNGLLFLLSDLESGALLLRVRELSVSQPEPAAPDERVEMLRGEIVVEALAHMHPRGDAR